MIRSTLASQNAFGRRPGQRFELGSILPLHDGFGLGLSHAPELDSILPLFPKIEVFEKAHPPGANIL